MSGNPPVAQLTMAVRLASDSFLRPPQVSVVPFAFSTARRSERAGFESRSSRRTHMYRIPGRSAIAALAIAAMLAAGDGDRVL
jgi:hypothetical protein